MEIEQRRLTRIVIESDERMALTPDPVKRGVPHNVLSILCDDGRERRFLIPHTDKIVLYIESPGK